MQEAYIRYSNSLSFLTIPEKFTQKYSPQSIHFSQQQYSKAINTRYKRRKQFHALTNVHPKQLRKSSDTLKLPVFGKENKKKKIIMVARREGMLDNQKLKKDRKFKDKIKERDLLSIDCAIEEIKKYTDDNRNETIKRDIGIIASLFSEDKISSIVYNVQFFKKKKMHTTLQHNLSKLFFHAISAKTIISVLKSKTHTSQLYSLSQLKAEGKDWIDMVHEDLQYCEYYSLKLDKINFALNFVLEEADLLMRYEKHDESLFRFRDALQLAIVTKNKQAQTKILEKLGVLYYYQGNSNMGQYYYQQSEIGLSAFESEIFMKQFKKEDQIRQLEEKLFRIPCSKMKKRKRTSKYDRDLNRQLSQVTVNAICAHQDMIAQMLKNQQTSPLGKHIREVILKNQSLAKCKNYSPQASKYHSQQKREINEKQDLYPMNHCTQIIKSHLSKNRKTDYFRKGVGGQGVRFAARMVQQLYEALLEDDY